jgi:hypothetical protein
VGSAYLVKARTISQTAVSDWSAHVLVTVTTTAAFSGSIDFTAVTGSTKPANNATVNIVTYSGTAPGSPVNGDIWVDTSVTPNLTKLRVSGAWQTGANLSTNTNQLTDGANLGGTAAWTGVTGTGRPADNATVNNVTYSASAPGSPVNGDIWVDTSAAPAVIKVRVAGVWQTGANLSTGALAQLNAVGTLNISGSAVTVPEYVSATSTSTTTGAGVWSGAILTSATVNTARGDGSFGDVVVVVTHSYVNTDTGTGNGDVGGTNGTTTPQFRLKFGGSVVSTWAGSQVNTVKHTPTASGVYTLEGYAPVGSGAGSTLEVFNRSMLILGVKR